MRVDFYQLSRDPAPQVAALLAGKALGAGAKVLVVADDKPLLDTISRSLWESSPESFLANGMAGGPHDARQPILLSGTVDPANGADMLILADGRWRDPGSSFARVMLLFDASTIDDARGTWRALGQRLEGDQAITRHFWKQDGGRWTEGP